MTTLPNIDDLLAQLAAATTSAEYMPLRSRCVQALDSYEVGAGIGPSRAAQWDRFERICAKVGPEIRKREYDSIPTYSLRELAAYQKAINEGTPVNLLDAVNQFRKEAAAVPLSQAVVTDFICALVASSTSLDAVGDEHVGVAAE
jgi:hypothetical protein